MTLLILIPALLAAAATVAVGFALRGRRVDDHPICRRCAFNLFGKPLGCTVCSECGTDLKRPRAVRRGRRERRGRLLAVAAPVLLLCLAWLGLLGWGAARGTEWNRYKAAWWLMREGRGQDAAVRDAALVELTSRFKNGKLSPEDSRALLDLALDIQGDRWRPWSDAVGDVIAAARDANQLPAEKRERYVRQASPPQLKVRPELRRGDPLALDLLLPTPRLARGDAQDVGVQCVRLRIGGANIVDQAATAGRRLKGGQSRGELSSVVPVGAAIARLPEGPQTVYATVHWTVRHTAPQKRRTLVDEKVELSAPLTIVPAVVSTRRLNTDPLLRESVEASLTVTRLGIGPGPRIGSGLQMFLHARAVNPPVGMAFRAILRSGAREWELGPLRFPPNRNWGCVASADLGHLAGFDAARVDVVLRPSAEEAMGTSYFTEIWGGEVVIKDVAVDPPPPGVRRE